VSEDERTPEEMFNAEDPVKWVPRDLAKGRSKDDIIAELLRFGWTSQEATALVDRVTTDLERYRSSPESRDRLVRAAFRQMAWGFGLAGIGVVIFLLIVLTEMGEGDWIGGSTKPPTY